MPTDLADYAVRQLRGRGIDIRLGTRIEEAAEDSTLLSTGERVPTRTLVWTAGVKPHPSLASLALPLDDDGPRARRRADAGRGHERRLGDRRLRRGPAPRRRRARVPADRGDGGPPGPGGRPQHRRRARRRRSAPRSFAYQGREAFVNLGRYKAVGKIDRLKFRGFVAWWMARTYHMSQIPGLARKIRAVVDWTVGLPFRRDTAEVGSIGHPRPLSGEVYARGGTHRPID